MNKRKGYSNLLDEFEYIESGILKANSVLKVDVYKNDEFKESYEFPEVYNIILSNTKVGAEVLLCFDDNKKTLNGLSDILKRDNTQLYCSVYFDSFFGPAVFSFETDTNVSSCPLDARNLDMCQYDLQERAWIRNVKHVEFYVVFKANNILFTVDGKNVTPLKFKSMFIPDRAVRYNYNPAELCDKLYEEMCAPDWFDSLKPDSIKDDIKNTKDRFLKAAENALTQLKPKNKDTKDAKETAVAQADIMQSVSVAIRQGSKDPMEDLRKMVGLEKVKKTITKLYSKQIFDGSMAAIKNKDASLHMCFLGNPGTGKTTVARIVTGILYDMNLIRLNQCVEINGLDLIGNYVGQTGIITKNIIDTARGGVLFVDEAYALTTSSNPYATEAVSVLLKEMEDNRGDLVVILAGYRYPMLKFLDMNSGFRSRINRYFEFSNYTVPELFEILKIELKNRGYAIKKEHIPFVLADFERVSKVDNFSNGRYVRNYVDKLEDEHIQNCAKILESKNIDESIFNPTSPDFIRIMKIFQNT